MVPAHSAARDFRRRRVRRRRHQRSSNSDHGLLRPVVCAFKLPSEPDALLYRNLAPCCDSLGVLLHECHSKFHERSSPSFMYFHGLQRHQRTPLHLARILPWVNLLDGVALRVSERDLPSTLRLATSWPRPAWCCKSWTPPSTCYLGAGHPRCAPHCPRYQRNGAASGSGPRDIGGCASWV
jgi:hypothetical protein